MTSPPRSRYIPAAVRRAVWERDGGRCAYVGPAGRCGQTRRLEFHHRIPFAEGGASTVANVAVTCAMHNRWEATRWFGEEVAPRDGRRAQARAPSEPPGDFDQSKRQHVPTDVPFPQDCDGDGVADGAVSRPSTGEWFVRPSSEAEQWKVVFGEAGDVPLRVTR